MYCYGSQWQPIFDDFKRLGVVYHQGLPEDLEMLFPPWVRPGLSILDDLMLEASQSPQVTSLHMLTRSMHHMDLFAITLMQNLYPGGRQQTTQNRNYHYTVLFRNPADMHYVKVLGNRWMGDSRGFWELYKKTHRTTLRVSFDRQPSENRRCHSFPNTPVGRRPATHHCLATGHSMMMRRQRGGTLHQRADLQRRLGNQSERLRESTRRIRW